MSKSLSISGPGICETVPELSQIKSKHPKQTLAQHVVCCMCILVMFADVHAATYVAFECNGRVKNRLNQVY